MKLILIMSLSKELCIRSDSKRKPENYRRDSFDDRFCGDLYEEILRYLTVGDKFRLECVSKQFQRTVFQNLNELNLNDSYVSVTQKWKHSDVWATHKMEFLAKKFQRLDCLQKVMSLSITFRDSDLRLLLPELKAFPALKRLDLGTDIHYWRIEGTLFGYEGFDFSKLFTLEAFKGLSNITHLTLGFNLHKYSYERLNEKVLKHIDINLPNLQYLEITDTFKTSSKRAKRMADILSRLSRLETLKLKFKTGFDLRPFVFNWSKSAEKSKK